MKTTPKEAHVTMNTVLNMGAQILTSLTVLLFGVLMSLYEQPTKAQFMTIVCLFIIIAYYFIAFILGMILEPKWKQEHKELAMTKAQADFSLGSTQDREGFLGYDNSGDEEPRPHLGSA